MEKASSLKRNLQTLDGVLAGLASSEPGGSEEGWVLSEEGIVGVQVSSMDILRATEEEGESHSPPFLVLRDWRLSSPSTSVTSLGLWCMQVDIEERRQRKRRMSWFRSSVGSESAFAVLFGGAVVLLGGCEDGISLGSDLTLGVEDGGDWFMIASPSESVFRSVLLLVWSVHRIIAQRRIEACCSYPWGIWGT